MKVDILYKDSIRCQENKTSQDNTVTGNVYAKDKLSGIGVDEATGSLQRKPKQRRVLPDVIPSASFRKNPFKVLKRWRPLARALLDKLLNWMFNREFTQFSQETIAEFLGASRTDICRLLGEMERLGLLTSHGHFKEHKLYQLSSVFFDLSFYKKIKRIIANLWGCTLRNRVPEVALGAISHTSSSFLSLSSYLEQDFPKVKGPSSKYSPKLEINKTVTKLSSREHRLEGSCSCSIHEKNEKIVKSSSRERRLEGNCVEGVPSLPPVRSVPSVSEGAKKSIHDSDESEICGIPIDDLYMTARLLSNKFISFFE